MTENEFITSLSLLYENEAWPKPLHLLYACHLVACGTSERDAASNAGTNVNKLREVLNAQERISAITGLDIPAEHENLPNWERTVGMLGQLLLGLAAERVFEDMFQEQMPNQELQILDVREGRSDTDYRLINGNERPVYRLNIKFHGARFWRANELIGLNPENSFALATYKIHGALKKQEEEHLPYFFAIVGESSLSGRTVGERLPRDLMNIVSYLSAAPKMRGKRELEDRVIKYVADNEVNPYPEVEHSLRAAPWYILSARRADRLLRDRLFDRVYALRIRNFSRVFRGAEIDMHFSLSDDLIPIEDFFATVRDSGLHAVTTRLERGDF